MLGVPGLLDPLVSFDLSLYRALVAQPGRRAFAWQTIIFITTGSVTIAHHLGGHVSLLMDGRAQCCDHHHGLVWEWQSGHLVFRRGQEELCPSMNLGTG